jgi:hypothetical protein
MSLSNHGPALLTSLVVKLEQLYNTIAGRGGNETALQTIPQIIMKAQEVNAQFSQ